MIKISRDLSTALSGPCPDAPLYALTEPLGRYVEGSSTNYAQLRRAPWMSPEFIDPTRMPDA